MKLYKLTSELGVYWVVADHPTQAIEKLDLAFDEMHFHFDARKISIIELIADQFTSSCDVGKYLIL